MMIVLLLKACLCVFLSQFSLSTPLHRHHDLKRRHGAAAEEEVSLPILDADHFNSRSVAPLEKFPCHDWTAQLRLERRHLLQEIKRLAARSLYTRKQLERVVGSAVVLSVLRANQKWITDENIQGIIERDREQLQSKLSKEMHERARDFKTKAKDALEEEEETIASCGPGKRKIIVVEEAPAPSAAAAAEEKPHEIHPSPTPPPPQIQIIPLPVPFQKEEAERESAGEEQEMQHLPPETHRLTHKVQLPPIQPKRMRHPLSERDLEEEKARMEGEVMEAPKEEEVKEQREEEKREKAAQQAPEVPEEEEEEEAVAPLHEERSKKKEMHEKAEEAPEGPMKPSAEDRRKRRAEEREEEIEKELRRGRQMEREKEEEKERKKEKEAEKKEKEEEKARETQEEAEKEEEKKEREAAAKEEKEEEKKREEIEGEKEKEEKEIMKLPIPPIPSKLPLPKISPEDLHPTWAPEETPPETPYVNPNYSEEEKEALIEKEEKKEGKTDIWIWVYFVLVYPAIVTLLLISLAWFL